MSNIVNVVRRGAIYHFRRSVDLGVGNRFCVSLSLLTTRRHVAKLRAARLTIRSEELLVDVMQLDTPEGLTPAQRAQIFKRELAKARDGLDILYLHAQSQESEDPKSAMNHALEAAELMYRDGIENGFPEDFGSYAHFEKRGFDRKVWPVMDSILTTYDENPDLKDHLSALAAEHIGELNPRPRFSPLNVQHARLVMLEARLAATQEFWTRQENAIREYANLMVPGDLAPLTEAVAIRPQPAAAAIPPLTVDEGPVDDIWTSLTPKMAAARYIADNPKTGGSGSSNKRRASWTDKTRTQFESAAMMLEKSYGSRPLYQLTQADLAKLDDHFNRLPVTHHKSPRHNGMSLEEICVEAEAQFAAKKLSQQKIGLGAATTNRHYGFLRVLVGWLQKKVQMSPLDWEPFIYEDDRDARDQREAITVENGRELFSLPVWMGCADSNRRMEPGRTIIHDAGYWVLLLAWYTGLRREEIAKLQLNDVDISDGIPHLKIRDTEAGRVKSASAVRLVPIASEVLRLGFLSYVESLRGAGEKQIFPELRSESGAQTFGDVYYKHWWQKQIAPKLSFVVPGLAMHSFRHMVSTELKDQHVFEEDRADLIGHKLTSETAGRYSKAARLTKLLDIVEKIPKVTQHLDAAPIKLLSAQDRRPRPVRVKQAYTLQAAE